jgi:NADPH2:quinone reductase
MPEAAAPAYRSGQTDPREVMVMLMVEAVRFGGSLGRSAFEVTAPRRPVLRAWHVRRRVRAPGPGRGAASRRHRERDRGVRARGIPAAGRGRAGRGAAGRLSPVIGQEYPLADAADAHAALESREAVAKTLLRP